MSSAGLEDANVFAAASYLISCSDLCIWHFSYLFLLPHSAGLLTLLARGGQVNSINLSVKFPDVCIYFYTDFNTEVQTCLIICIRVK